MLGEKHKDENNAKWKSADLPFMNKDLIYVTLAIKGCKSSLSVWPYWRWILNITLSAFEGFLFVFCL